MDPRDGVSKLLVSVSEHRTCYTGALDECKPIRYPLTNEVSLGISIQGYLTSAKHEFSSIGRRSTNLVPSDQGSIFKNPRKVLSLRGFSLTYLQIFLFRPLVSTPSGNHRNQLSPQVFSRVVASLQWTPGTVPGVHYVCFSINNPLPHRSFS